MGGEKGRQHDPAEDDEKDECDEIIGHGRRLLTNTAPRPACSQIQPVRPLNGSLAKRNLTDAPKCAKHAGMTANTRSRAICICKARIFGAIITG